MTAENSPLNPPFQTDFTQRYTTTSLAGDFRQTNDDFFVEEQLGFEPSGDGEHQLIFLEKRGENTQWLAQQIAKLAGVSTQDVGYCGRKDRHAVTRQWFSIYLPKQNAIEWSELNSDSCEVLRTSQHLKKLRPGMHASNFFRIRLRAVRQKNTQTPANADDLSQLQQQIDQVITTGVPNFFGPQRFGQEGRNLERVAQWFESNRKPRRDQRSIILSSARSYLFNLVLDARVANNNWQQCIAGDVANEHEQPTGPLWGRGRSASKDDALVLETDILAPWQAWRDGLEHQGLKQERRDLVLLPENLQWQQDQQDLVFSFTLPTGAYATVLLGHLLTLTNSDSPST